jgi:hypothetical protein
MRERTSVRALARELRARLPGLMEAARGLPALLGGMVERELSGARAPRATVAAPDALELRAALAHAARRRDAVIVGAALLLGALVWLAVAREPPWVGWALLAAGGSGVVYGLWRSH